MKQTPDRILSRLVGPRWDISDDPRAGIFLGQAGPYDVYWWAIDRRLFIYSQEEDIPKDDRVKHIEITYVRTKSVLYGKWTFSTLPKPRQLAYRYGRIVARKRGLIR